MDLNNYTSLPHYAERQGVSVGAVRKRVLEGNLPAVKIGRNWLILKDEPYVDHRKSEYSTRDRKAERRKKGDGNGLK